LVTKEQLIEIEKLYRQALPLPNPDIHEIIGEQINLSPSKVFFGMNLVREKMKLPKLEYPKRKLAVSPEQLMAIETLYEPYLPLPPLGIHKIIARQLRMDEWRVHVAIGLIRKNRNLNRWNEDRDDLPPEMKESQRIAREEKEKADKEKAAAEAVKATKAKAAPEDSPEDSELKPETEVQAAAETEEAPAPKARATRAKAAAAAVDADEPAEEGEEVVAKPKAIRGRKAAVATAEVADLQAIRSEESEEGAEVAPKPKARATRAVKEK